MRPSAQSGPPLADPDPVPMETQSPLLLLCTAVDSTQWVPFISKAITEGNNEPPQTIFELTRWGQHCRYEWTSEWGGGGFCSWLLTPSISNWSGMHMQKGCMYCMYVASLDFKSMQWEIKTLIWNEILVRLDNHKPMRHFCLQIHMAPKRSWKKKKTFTTKRHTYFSVRICWHLLCGDLYIHIFYTPRFTWKEIN